MTGTRVRSVEPALLLVVLLGCSGEAAPGSGAEIASSPGAEVTLVAPSASARAFAPSGLEDNATTGELVGLLGPRHGAWLAAVSRGDGVVARAPATLDVHTSASALASSSTPSSISSGIAPAARVAPSIESSVAGGSRVAQVVLPELAQGAFELRDRRTSLGIGVRLRGARAVPRRQVDTLSLYGGGAGDGTTLVLHPSERGVEDFIVFDAAPPRPEVEYEVALEAGIAGLRLVEQTLEFLDAGGAPRLRVEPPYLVGAAGQLARAELAVAGCAVDENPAPPWGRAPLPPGAATCRVRVVWDPAAVTYPALLDPVWSLAGSMSQTRERFASSVLEDGRVLVAGGVASASGERRASAEVFDPASETWSSVGSLLNARSDFTLSEYTLPGGAAGVLAAGGESGAGALSGVELFDPAAGTWSAGPSLPSGYAGHSATRLEDGSVLVAGGAGSSAAARLDAGATRWREAGELLAEAPDSTLTRLAGGGALLVGPNAPSLQRYFPDENLWLVAGEPQLPRAGHTATRLTDGRVLLVGGHGTQSGTQSGSHSVELYDPATESSRFVGATSEPRTGHTATLLADGRVVVVGGAGAPGASGTEIYDPEWGTWTTGPGTLQGRSEHQAALLADGSVLVAGGVAPDGPVLASAQRLEATRAATVISEYKLPARRDATITSASITELWAAIVRPAELEDGRRYPLLLFLHGNHGTCGTGENPRSDFDCTYTSQGTCPEGSVVVPSHRGYDYVATELAARGFIVVSVNANRGITCGGGEPDDFGFNLARGKLLLKHLEQLSQWDRGVGEPPESVGVSLQGKLDFTQVGMMGHSRGGEGVRAAYEQYRDADSPWPVRIVQPVVIRGLFEIGPVDGQTSRVLNADSTAWTVLLPMCDGDVSDLQGVKPFDRMLELSSERRETPKSTYVAWGTNHNYFNSEWQESDSPGCTDHRALFDSGPGITGSAEQRQIGLRSMLAFFLGNVGAQRNPSLNQQFDPTAPLASDTRIDRGFTPSLRPNRGITLEDFSGPSGLSSRGLPMLAQNLDVSHVNVPEHDERLNAAHLAWPAGEPSAADERLLQVPWSASPAGVDLSGYTHLEFRAGRQTGDDLLEPTPLLVQLVNADGSFSEALDSAAYGLRLDGPVGGPYNTHVVMQTARIPLTEFRNASRGALRGVRLHFPGASGAELYIASVRASLGSGRLSPAQAAAGPAQAGTATAAPLGGVGLAPPGPSQVLPGERPRLVRQLFAEGNAVVALRRVEGQRVELELFTPQAFQAQNDQLLLELGNVRSNQSRHPDGALGRVVFTVDAQAFAAVQNREPIHVRYASNDSRQWDFGPLEKSILQQ